MHKKTHPPPKPDSSTTPAAKSGRVNRLRPIRVYVTDEEREELALRAEETGLSLTRFLAGAALNRPIRSMLDREIALDLMKASADQGRFGGLLKKWLAEKRGEGASVADVNAALRTAHQIQRTILQLASDVRRLT